MILQVKTPKSLKLMVFEKLQKHVKTRQHDRFRVVLRPPWPVALLLKKDYNHLVVIQLSYKNAVKPEFDGLKTLDGLVGERGSAKEFSTLLRSAASTVHTANRSP